MRVETPQIAWHQSSKSDVGKNVPILTCDFRPVPFGTKGVSKQIMATGGSDSTIRIWCIDSTSEAQESKENSQTSSSIATNKDSEKAVKRTDVSFMGVLQGHQKTVNCVRWSPNGECLASASDDGRVFIWCRNPDFTDSDWTWDDLTEGTVNKSVSRILLGGHSNDVYTLEWSPDGLMLVSGSIDGSAIIFIWNVRKRKQLEKLSDHSHYVQGVTWDPHDQMVYTQSSDRSVRVYTLPRFAASKGKRFTCVVKALVKHRSLCHKPVGSETVHSDNEGKSEEKNEGKDSNDDETDEMNKKKGKNRRAPQKKHAMFMDETVPTFFRRLSTSPDGSFLFTPTGCFMSNAGEAAVPTTFIFLRGVFSRPALHLPTPGMDQPSIAVRCHPRLQPENGVPSSPPLIALPYRVVFAVATLSNILVYDTQQADPIALVGNVHYAQITDITWCANGAGDDCIAISSQDGYITLLTFTEGELGEVLTGVDVPEVMRRKLPVIFQKIVKKNKPENTKISLSINNENDKKANDEIQQQNDSKNTDSDLEINSGGNQNQSRKRKTVDGEPSENTTNDDIPLKKSKKRVLLTRVGDVSSVDRTSFGWENPNDDSIGNSEKVSSTINNYVPKGDKSDSKNDEVEDLDDLDDSMGSAAEEEDDGDEDDDGFLASEGEEVVENQGVANDETVGSVLLSQKQLSKDSHVSEKEQNEKKRKKKRVTLTSVSGDVTPSGAFVM